MIKDKHGGLGTILLIIIIILIVLGFLFVRSCVQKVDDALDQDNIKSWGEDLKDKLFDFFDEEVQEQIENNTEVAEVVI